MIERTITSPSDLTEIWRAETRKRGTFWKTVSKAAGVAPGSSYEVLLGRGNPTIKTMLALCGALGLKVIVRAEDGEPPCEILREFQCKECGHTVSVTDERDRRTVFCCEACEKKYWKHDYLRHNENKHGRESQGMSSGMSLGSLIRRERRDLL